MLKKLFAKLPGYVTVSTADVKRAGNVILHRGLVCSNMKVLDGRLYLDVDLLSFKQKIKNFDEFDIKWKIEKAEGLAFFIYRYQKRYGLFLGFALFIALLYLSQSFIWSVSVAPVNGVDSDLVINNLSELDFGVGSFIPKKDVLAISNSYLLHYDDLSYIAINIVGNCAEILTLPAFETPVPTDPAPPSSIIASRDGFIERLEVISGTVVKNAGQAVQKGDVIVSGLVEDVRDNTYRLVRSEARAFAKTHRQFTVKVPLDYVEKVKTTVEKVDKTILFFSKEIKFSKNSCVFDDEYDIMISEEPLFLFGSIKLPISIKTTTATKISQTKVTVDENTAGELADKKLRNMLDKEDLEIISINKQFITEGDTLTMVCTVYCIENIALEMPMTGIPLE